MATFVAATPRVPFELRKTNLEGVFTPPPLPAGFDPKTASEASLLKAGIMLRRPTETDPPAVTAAWDLATGRDWEQIVPESSPQHGKSHVLDKSKLRKAADGTFVGGAWAGAGLVGNGPFTSVIGYWTIPTVSKPSEPQGGEGGWHASTWIGLDGGNPYGGSDDVIQAGVEEYVSANGTATYTPWYEWYAPAEAGSPGYIYQTNVNLPVAPGQEMYCSVGLSNGVGHIYFGNATLNKYIQLTLAKPPGATADGDTAEWIVEAPDGGEPYSALPRFNPVVFTTAVACLANSTANADTSNEIYEIETSTGKLLTSVSLGNDQVTVDFIG